MRVKHLRQEMVNSLIHEVDGIKRYLTAKIDRNWQYLRSGVWGKESIKDDF